jgi:Sec-independent protein translocase protein TatA
MFVTRNKNNACIKKNKNFLILILTMSGIRPQQQQPQASDTPQQPPPPAPSGAVISVDKLWQIGISLVLLLTIVLVGYFMLRAFWRYLQHKLVEFSRRSAEQATEADDEQQQQQQDDDGEDEEPEERIIVQKKKKTTGANVRRK